MVVRIQTILGPRYQICENMESKGVQKKSKILIKLPLQCPNEVLSYAITDPKLRFYNFMVGIH